MTYNLDPELQSLIKMKATSFNPLIFRLEFNRLKDMYRCLDTDAEIEYQLIQLENYRIILIQPKNLSLENHPCMVYFHGGAFLYRGWDNHYKCCAEYAKAIHGSVLYVDYRLTYHSQYGDTLNDAIDAYHWAKKNADQYHFDRNQILLGGDSAGGYLALKVAQYLHVNNFPKPMGNLLLYPCVDPTCSEESMKEFKDSPVWNGIANEKMWKLYLKGHHEPSLLDLDFSFLSDTYLEVTEFDCLRDEDLKFYQKIKDNGNIVLNDTKGTVHGYDMDFSLNIVRKNLKMRCSFLKSLCPLKK